MSRRGTTTAVAAALALLAFAPHASAKMRAVLREIGEDDRALERRVVGHVADLDVDVVVVASPTLEQAIAAQLATADALAKQNDARVVVWFVIDRGAVIVSLSEPESGRVLLRRVGDDADAHPSSATLEEAALVVRTALRALAAGGVIGVAKNELVPEAPAATTKSPEIPEAPPSPPAGSNDRWRALVALGWRASDDGEGSVGAHGLGVDVGVRRGPLEFRLEGALGFPTREVDAFASVRVVRDALALFAGGRLLGGPSFEALGGVRVGAMIFSRTTDDATTGVAATAAHRTPSFVAGPTLGLRARLADPLFVRADAGIDWVPGAPTIGYEVAGAFVPSRTLWTWEPRFSLGFELFSR